MKKIRINVLARELEVKSHLVLELLTEFGVTEKLTHSSSIDDDVAHHSFIMMKNALKLIKVAEFSEETVGHVPGLVEI